MNEHIEDVLALLIITNKNFANAYQLCKILAWKFDVINCSEIIKRIDAKGYVHKVYLESKTLESFNLTEVGKEILKEHENLLIETLKENFPGEIDFVNKLLGNIPK